MPDDPRSRPIVRAPLMLFLCLASGCDGPPPTFAMRGSLKGHAKEVVALAFAPDGKALASRSADAVKVWDVVGLAERRAFPTDGSAFAAVAFSPDGKTLAENRAGVGAVAWDLASGQQKLTYRYPSLPEGSASNPASYGWGLAYSPDGKTLAAGGSHQGSDSFATLWEASTGEGVNLGPYQSPVSTVAYSSDGRTVAVGSMAGPVDLWDPATHRVRTTLTASRAYLAPVAFSPDGRTLATATEDRTVKLWDVESGRERGPLKGHLKGVCSVAFHPGGQALASGDGGGTIFVWDLISRRPIARLMGHRGKVWAVAFSPGGRLMASAGEDREVRFWDVPAGVRTADH